MVTLGLEGFGVEGVGLFDAAYITPDASAAAYNTPDASAAASDPDSVIAGTAGPSSFMTASIASS